MHAVISSVHFHSSLPSGQQHGWSFRSHRAVLSLRCDSQSLKTTLASPNGIGQVWDDPLQALDWMSNHHQANARWAGYLSYDLGRLFESQSSIATDDLQLPLFCFSLFEAGDADETTTFPLGIRRQLESSLPKPMYLDTIRRAIDYIRAGDVFQVNLSQRFTAGLTLQPTQIWQNLVERFPAAYGAALHCGDHVILSNSPELFLRVSANRHITTRPIKGTRPRASGMEEELLHSEKDQAELNMIVDLERNDLGRVCQVGSVKVTQPRTIEAHPHRLSRRCNHRGKFAKRCFLRRAAASHFPRRIGNRRAENPINANHRRIGAGSPRAVLRSHRLPRPRRLHAIQRRYSYDDRKRWTHSRAGWRRHRRRFRSAGRVRRNNGKSRRDVRGARHYPIKPAI